VSDSNSFTRWHISCRLTSSSEFSGFFEEGREMERVVARRLDEPLPLSTAMLSNIALSLLMWNIALRIADLLLTA
jgi:hypothetical protein